MIMSYFKKGKQLAKSDLQHQPCPAITLPLTLHTVANESFADFNPQMTVLTQKRLSGTKKLKVVKSSCKSKRYGVGHS